MERKLIAAAVSSALALPMAAQAIEFSVSGHVNRAVVMVDQTGYSRDGDLQHVDADSSQTRFRFKGSEELGNGLTAGVNLELGVLSTGPASGTTTRHAAAYIDTAGGKLTLGHTSTAADSMAYAKLGGPSWLGGVTNWCSYYSAAPLVCADHDGNRRDVLRYDSPSFGPVSFAVSTGDNEYWDGLLKAAGDVDAVSYDLRVGFIGKYDVPGTGPGTVGGLRPLGDTLAASAALKFQGTSFATAWGKARRGDSTPRDRTYIYGELDQSYGDGSVGVYFKKATSKGRGSNPGPDVEGSYWGVGWGHNIGGGATVYAGMRDVEQDNLPDSTMYVAGMRVTFN